MTTSFSFVFNNRGPIDFDLHPRRIAIHRVRVKIEEGIWLSRFPLFGLILTALFFFLITLRRVQFEHRRWQHLHEDDE